MKGLKRKVIQALVSFNNRFFVLSDFTDDAFSALFAKLLAEQTMHEMPLFSFQIPIKTQTKTIQAGRNPAAYNIAVAPLQQCVLC